MATSIDYYSPEGQGPVERSGTVKQIVLQKIAVSCDFMISRAQMENFRLEEFYDYLNNRITYQLRGYLLGEEVYKETVKWPADWWQHFKLRWFSHTMLKQWPVKYKGFTFSAKAIYPKLNFALPREQRHVTFSKLNLEDEA